MKSFAKLLFAGTFGVLAFGLSAASASHNSDYRDSGASFSIRVSDSQYRDGRHYVRYDRSGRRHGYRGRAGRIINREVFNTRFRARIVLIEEAVRTRRGPRLVCTVKARGPEALYVSERRMRRIARNNCSRRAHIRVFA